MEPFSILSRESSFCGTIINPCAFEHEFIFAEHCEPVEVAKGMPFEEEKSEEYILYFILYKVKGQRHSQGLPIVIDRKRYFKTSV